MTFKKKGDSGRQLHGCLRRYDWSICVVGAGAVVARNVPDHALVVGNPGKPIGWMCRCGERLTDDLQCLACDRGYRKTESGMVAGKQPLNA